jgi:hypothetical protein
VLLIQADAGRLIVAAGAAITEIVLDELPGEQAPPEGVMVKPMVYVPGVV